MNGKVLLSQEQLNRYVVIQEPGGCSYSFVLIFLEGIEGIWSNRKNSKSRCEDRLGKGFTGIARNHPGALSRSRRDPEVPGLVGAFFAMEMIFTGQPLTAAESLRIGLANKVVPPDGVLAAAKEPAHLMASRPGVALKLVKEVIKRGI